MSFQPDIYTSVNLQAMHTLEKAGLIEPGAYRLYLHNRLALMVPEGNPANIKTVSNLGKNEMRISQPDPANEDIAHHILDMYRQAGGQELVDHIMTEKRAQGTTVMTVVHHRETPLRLTKRSVENTDSFPMRRVVRRGIKSLSFLVQKDHA